MCLYNVLNNENDYYSNLHIPDSVEFIDSKPNYSVVSENGLVQLWEFGSKNAEAKIFADAKYVGYSYWEGYLLHHYGDVYSVQLKEMEGGYK